MPRLCVLLPARNAAGTIRRAVASTLRAMPADSELVVGDDSSTDATAERAQEAAAGDPRLRVVPIAPGEGGVARVLGQLMAATDSSLVGRMDADDVSLRGRFRRCGAAIGRGDDMVFTQIVELRGRCPVPRAPYAIGPDEMPWHLLLTNPVCHPTMVATRDCLDRVGGYRNVPAEDYDLWLRVAADGGAIRRLAAWGLVYRIHPTQVTASQRWRAESWNNELQARAFADLAQRLTGRPLPRLVALPQMPASGARAALDDFEEAFRARLSALPIRAAHRLERRLNGRIRWVRARMQGDDQ